MAQYMNGIMGVINIVTVCCYTISSKVKEKKKFFRLAEFSCVTDDKLKL